MKKMAAILAGLMMMAAGSAWAVPSLSLSDGATTVVVSDGGVGDSNPLAGAVTYIGTVGNFILNVATGQSDPLLGPVGLAHMDLNSANTSTGTGGTITIMWTDTGFTSPAPGFSSKVGGTLGAGAFGTFQTWLDNGNGEFALTTQLANMIFGPGGAFSGTADFTTAAVPAFSITEVAILTHPEGTIGSSFDLELQPVPEPGTIVLLGAGLLGLGFYGRRRMQK